MLEKAGWPAVLSGLSSFLEVDGVLQNLLTWWNQQGVLQHAFLFRLFPPWNISGNWPLLQRIFSPAYKSTIKHKCFGCIIFSIFILLSRCQWVIPQGLGHRFQYLCSLVFTGLAARLGGYCVSVEILDTSHASMSSLWMHCTDCVPHLLTLVCVCVCTNVSPWHKDSKWSTPPLLYWHDRFLYQGGVSLLSYFMGCNKIIQIPHHTPYLPPFSRREDERPDPP